MPCATWGSGTKWGDGTLWCRQFGSSNYMVENVDTLLHRCSVQVTYASASNFVIDRITPNIDWGRSQQDYTYEAFLDADLVRRCSVQIAFAYDTSFVIRDIFPHVRLKKHQPIG